MNYRRADGEPDPELLRADEQARSADESAALRAGADRAATQQGRQTQDDRLRARHLPTRRLVRTTRLLRGIRTCVGKPSYPAPLPTVAQLRGKGAEGDNCPPRARAGFCWGPGILPPLNPALPRAQQTRGHKTASPKYFLTNDHKNEYDKVC